MRLAGYGLDDACRTTATPNERPILETVDGRYGTTYHCLEADFRYGSPADRHTSFLEVRSCPESGRDDCHFAPCFVPPSHYLATLLIPPAGTKAAGAKTPGRVRAVFRP